MRKVKLQNQGVLDGVGYMWEWSLAQAGWNELPEEKKYGLADENLIVVFPHCDNIEYPLFYNEVIFVDN